MPRLKLLFVCIGNSCRSPMAEAMARSLGGDRVEVHSAGLAPAGFIAAPTVTTLQRLGYSAEGLTSQGLEAFDSTDFDIVVSMLGGGIHHAIPCAPHTLQINWAIPDPFGEDEAQYLRVAREIEARVRGLLDEELAGELLPD
jgi:protein-tyrosine-phosphatase